MNQHTPDEHEPDKPDQHSRVRHVLGPRFFEAVELAGTWHRHHERKGTEIAYLTHLLAVASLVVEHGGDEDLAIAALLHDAIEDVDHLCSPACERMGGADADRLRDEIRSRFGQRVLDVVEGCTDTETPGAKEPWHVRKERYLHHVEHVADDETVLVSLADKVHNARSLAADQERQGDAHWHRFNASKDDSEQYYRKLLGAFRARRPDGCALVRELELALDRVWPPS